jgi:hypothetical protein
MTLAELVQHSRRVMSADYTINPLRVAGLHAVEIDGVPLFYAETAHTAEMIAQILLAAGAEDVTPRASSDDPSDSSE